MEIPNLLKDISVELQSCGSIIRYAKPEQLNVVQEKLKAVVEELDSLATFLIEQFEEESLEMDDVKTSINEISKKGN